MAALRLVQRGSPASFVVDDVATVDPWSPRGVEIRGTAVALTDHEPPVPFFSREIIRITPTKIISWYIDGPRSSRAVRVEGVPERGYTSLSGWLLAKLAQAVQPADAD